MNDRNDLPDELFTSDLTLENFGERTQNILGVRKRFRVTPEQKMQIKAGTLTREQAFGEFLAYRLGQINIHATEMEFSERSEHEIFSERGEL